MAAVELLASGYGLIEGPRVDPEGSLYFSDVPNGGVFRRRPNGEIEIAIPKRRGVGGMVFHADGGLVVGGRTIQHVKDGNVRTVWEPADGAGLNDLTTDREGRIYVGTLRSDPHSGDRDRPSGECWRIELDGSVSQVYDDISLSNGIGLSPDGRTIYHVDTARREVVAHDIAGGRCINRRVFARLERGSPDGMALDADGGVWLAAYRGGCVAHFDARGSLVEYIDVPARGVTSVCFGGADMRDLYIVTEDNDDAALKGSVFRTRASVAGAPTPLARV